MRSGEGVHEGAEDPCLLGDPPKEAVGLCKFEGLPDGGPVALRGSA